MCALQMVSDQSDSSASGNQPAMWLLYIFESLILLEVVLSCFRFSILKCCGLYECPTLSRSCSSAINLPCFMVWQREEITMTRHSWATLPPVLGNEPHRREAGARWHSGNENLAYFTVFIVRYISHMIWGRNINLTADLVSFRCRFESVRPQIFSLFIWLHTRNVPTTK